MPFDRWCVWERYTANPAGLCANALWFAGQIRVRYCLPKPPARFRTPSAIRGAKCAWKPCLRRGASSELHRFPPSYLAPNRLLQWTSVEKATTDLPYELGGTKIGSWGSLRPVGAPKEKPPYDQQFPKEPRAAKSLSSSETCAIGTLSRRASGLCGMQFPYAQAVQRHAGLLLFGTFSFKERKSTPFPLIKGKSFIKSPVCWHRTKTFFLL